MTLPDDDTPRERPKRRWLIAPYMLALVVAIAWSAAWVYLKISAERTLDQTARSLKAEGYQVSWGSRRITGYPFRLETVFTDARIAEPSGWALSAPELKAEAVIYRLDHWVAIVPEGVVLHRPRGGSVTIRGELLRAGFSDLGKRPANIVVEGRKLTFTQGAGAEPYPLVSADKLVFNLRPGPDDQAAVLLQVDNAGARFTGLLARIAQDRPVSLNWESILNHVSAFDGPTWPGAVQAWTAAGGAIRVRQASITAGDALATAKSGELTVGPDGRLRGSLEVDLREAPALGGAITPEAAIAALSGGSAQADVRFEDGQTLLGPLSVGPAPRVY